MVVFGWGAGHPSGVVVTLVAGTVGLSHHLVAMLLPNSVSLLNDAEERLRVGSQHFNRIFHPFVPTGVHLGLRAIPVMGEFSFEL